MQPESKIETPVAPTTTTEEDVTTASQRKINLIWEYTQAFIAIIVVIFSLIGAVIAMWQGKEVSAFLSFICGNIVGFYFSRTNHAAIGGVGTKPTDTQNYVGR